MTVRLGVNRCAKRQLDPLSRLTSRNDNSVLSNFEESFSHRLRSALAMSLSKVSECWGAAF